jgi:hypothetical protein
MALSEIAKRGFRSLWVLFVNGFVVRRIFISFFGDPFNRATVYTKNEIEFVLWAGLPILGMVFELINSRFARWLNVGYLSAFALLYLVDAVNYWSDPYHGVLVLIGGALLVMAYITDVIYRLTKNRSASANTFENAGVSEITH